MISHPTIVPVIVLIVLLGLLTKSIGRRLSYVEKNMWIHNSIFLSKNKHVLFNFFIWQNLTFMINNPFFFKRINQANVSIIFQGHRIAQRMLFILHLKEYDALNQQCKWFCYLQELSNSNSVFPWHFTFRQSPFHLSPNSINSSTQ